MHLDIVLLVVLAALAVWTEVDKLRSRRMPQLLGQAFAPTHRKVFLTKMTKSERPSLSSTAMKVAP
jgi:hypothetical protein